MVLNVYLLTPDRRKQILGRRARQAESGAPPATARTITGAEHLTCYACGEPIRLLSWVVSRPSRVSHKQYHYRCWKWGNVKDLPAAPPHKMLRD